jgi:hypothetical protein
LRCSEPRSACIAITEEHPGLRVRWFGEATMFEVKDPVAIASTGAALSPEQQGIGQRLRQYYQLHCVGPTPKRLQMLLNELNRRAEGKRDALKGSGAG